MSKKANESITFLSQTEQHIQTAMSRDDEVDTDKDRLLINHLNDVTRRSVELVRRYASIDPAAGVGGGTASRQEAARSSLEGSQELHQNDDSTENPWNDPEAMLASLKASRDELSASWKAQRPLPETENDKSIVEINRTEQNMALTVNPLALVTMESSFPSWSSSSSSHLNRTQGGVSIVKQDGDVEADADSLPPAAASEGITTNWSGPYPSQSQHHHHHQQQQQRLLLRDGVPHLEKDFQTISLRDQQPPSLSSSSSSSSPPPPTTDDAAAHQGDEPYIRHVRRNMISAL